MIPGRYRVQVLDRSFRILDALADAADELSPAELAARLRLHKSTIHRPQALDTLIERLQFTRHTRRTIVTPSALRAALDRVRRRGFAVDDEEVEEGLRCIGAPIRDYTGNAVAALSIAGPVFRIPKGQIAVCARAVTAAADSLSAALGYVKPQARGWTQVS